MAVKKPQFATSIDKKIADNFRKSCDEYGFRMNVVLESFMEQLSNGDLVLKLDGKKLKIEEKK